MTDITASKALQALFERPRWQDHYVRSRDIYKFRLWHLRAPQYRVTILQHSDGFKVRWHMSAGMLVATSTEWKQVSDAALVEAKLHGLL